MVHCPRSTSYVVRALIIAIGVISLFNGPSTVPVASLLGPSSISSVTASALPWISATALIDVNFSSHRPPAAGCPPPSELCRLEHVFDEIIVLSLPRFASRAARMAGQLEALGAPFTLVHAYDTRVVGPAANPKLRPAEFALWLTQVAVFQYIAKSPFRNFLLFEDDATLAADFPATFDVLARALPDNWRFVNLGQTIFCFESYAHCTTSLPTPIARVGSLRGRIYGAFSVAFERAAADDVALALSASKDAIDREPYETMQAKWGNESFFAWPPVVAMDPFTGSTIGNSWAVPVKAWKEQNGIEARRFDFRGGGFRASGEAAPIAFEGDCDAIGAVETGVDFYGADITWGWPYDKQQVQPLSAADPRECCVHCVDAFPICQAWTHVAGVGCFLKQAVLSRVEGKGVGYASGTLQRTPSQNLDRQELVTTFPSPSPVPPPSRVNLSFTAFYHDFSPLTLGALYILDVFPSWGGTLVVLADFPRNKTRNPASVYMQPAILQVLPQLWVTSGPCAGAEFMSYTDDVPVPTEYEKTDTIVYTLAPCDGGPAAGAEESIVLKGGGLSDRELLDATYWVDVSTARAHITRWPAPPADALVVTAIVGDANLFLGLDCWVNYYFSLGAGLVIIYDHTYAWDGEGTGVGIDAASERAGKVRGFLDRQADHLGTGSLLIVRVGWLPLHPEPRNDYLRFVRSDDMHQVHTFLHAHRAFPGASWFATFDPDEYAVPVNGFTVGDSLRDHLNTWQARVRTAYSLEENLPAVLQIRSLLYTRTEGDVFRADLIPSWTRVQANVPLTYSPKLVVYGPAVPLLEIMIRHHGTSRFRGRDAPLKGCTPWNGLVRHKSIGDNHAQIRGVIASYASMISDALVHPETGVLAPVELNHYRWLGRVYTDDFPTDVEDNARIVALWPERACGAVGE